MAKQKVSSTQDHLDIDDITDDLVLLKTGWVALVMSTTAVNFDLLSEAEQDATIYAYGAFLNSLSFPLEVLVRSKKADITSYFQSLEEAEASLPNPDLKRQIQKYKDFIQSTVQQKTVLDKKFYLIINYSPLESGFSGLGKTKKTPQKSKASLLVDAKAALAPKRDHVFKQTARLGLITKQLTTQELIELFYDIYNPAPTGTQRVILDTKSYTTPIVEPALEVPEPAPEGLPGVLAAMEPVAEKPPVAAPTLVPTVSTPSTPIVIPQMTPVPLPNVQVGPPPTPPELRPVEPQTGRTSQLTPPAPVIGESGLEPQIPVSDVGFRPVETSIGDIGGNIPVHAPVPQVAPDAQVPVLPPAQVSPQAQMVVPPAAQSSTSQNQLQAMKNLQDAAARASQLLSSVAPQAPTAPGVGQGAGPQPPGQPAGAGTAGGLNSLEEGQK